MKKNIVLMRVSSNKQETNSQRLAIEKYCKDNQIIIDEIIESKISGYKTKLDDREDLQKLKQMALNDELQLIIVFNSDRIGRRIEILSFVSLMTECDVEIHSVTEGIINDNSEANELIQAIKFWQNSNESRKISARVSSGKANGVKNGRFQSSKPVFGYKLIDTKLIADEQLVPIVREMFELYISVGTSKTIEILKEKYNISFSRQTLLNNLKNTTYIGYLNSKYESDYIKELQIIDTDTFEKVQDLIKSRTYERNKTVQSVKSKLLLESLLYHQCTKDKLSKLYVSYTYSANEKYPTYRCDYCYQNRLQNQKTFSARKIHKAVEQEVIKQLNKLDMEVVEDIYCRRKALELHQIQLQIDNHRNVLEAKRKALENANNTLEAIFSGTSNLSLDVVNNLIIKLQSEIIELKKQINNLDTELHKKELRDVNKAKLVKRFKEIKDIYQVADKAKKKTLLNEMIEKIIIDKDDITIYFNL